MTVVIDTAVLVDQLRGLPAAAAALGELAASGEAIAGSVLTRTEVLAGMRTAGEPGTMALLSALDWIPVTVEIADRAGHLARRFLRSHPGIDTVDYVVAATVEAVGGRLWTRNLRHFPMFPGLSAPY